MPIRPLSKELQELAVVELNEDPDRIQHDLKVIRKWAEGKKHIRLREDDQWLVTFLRGCCFDLELAKKKLDLLYTARPLAPEFLSDRDPFLPEIQELLKLGCCLPLPKSPGSVPVILIRVKPFDPRKNRLEDGTKMFSMMLDIILNEDDFTIVNGAHILIDPKGLTLQHILLGTPSIIRKFIKCFIDAYPTRPKGFHIINAPSLVYMAFNALKYLLSNRLLNLIYFYGSDSMDKVRELVPISALPEEYGGEGPALEELTAQWKEKVESYRDWYFEDEQYFSPKENSSEKLKCNENSSYLVATFNKLEID